MHPTLREGEEIEVKLGTYPAERAAFGDTIVYVDDAGHAIVHRVLGRYRSNGKQMLLEAGDANWTCRSLPAERVVGRVSSIRTPSGIIGTSSTAARGLARLSALSVAACLLCDRLCPLSRHLLDFPRRVVLQLCRDLLLILCGTPTSGLQAGDW
jgi:hypothetical protein